jgi:hypothetical protein
MPGEITAVAKPLPYSARQVARIVRARGPLCAEELVRIARWLGIGPSTARRWQRWWRGHGRIVSAQAARRSSRGHLVELWRWREGGDSEYPVIST